MILSFERSVFEESVEGWGRDRAGNGRVEGGAVYKAITKLLMQRLFVCLVHTV